jgi:hypothetical protein
MRRRDVLKLGLGSALFAGLGLRMVHGATSTGGRARSIILLYMEGGPSQLDTFDPKPGRPTGGEFQAIATSVAGVQISEHLPQLAKRMDRIALLRTVSSVEGNHERARYLLHAGYSPQGGVRHPSLGAILGSERPKAKLPSYVSVGGPGQDAGFLGAAFDPFPVRDPAKPVRYLTSVVEDTRFDDRIAIWRDLEDDFAATHPGPLADGRRAVGEEAVAMMRAPDAAAFSLATEPPALRAAYGETSFGLGCLMARRLVEAGVPFVEVTLRGWDTHKDNFETVKKLSVDLDAGMSALLDDLKSRGLLETTLVVWCGEFGRTPKINDAAGRDHYPQCFTVALAGGGVRGGQAVGRSDADGVAIAERPLSVPDVFRTAATLVGLDPDKKRIAPSGRPIQTVDASGKIITELV